MKKKKLVTGLLVCGLTLSVSGVALAQETHSQQQPQLSHNTQSHSVKVPPKLDESAPIHVDNGVATIGPGQIQESNSSSDSWGQTEIGGVNKSEITKVVIKPNTKAPRNSDSLFANMPNCTEIDGLTNLDTSGTMGMAYFFANDPKIKTLDVSSFDTSNVNDMSGMFSGVWENDSHDGSKGNLGSLTSITGLNHFKREKTPK